MSGTPSGLTAHPEHKLHSVLAASNEAPSSEVLTSALDGERLGESIARRRDARRGAAPTPRRGALVWASAARLMRAPHAASDTWLEAWSSSSSSASCTRSRQMVCRAWPRRERLPG